MKLLKNLAETRQKTIVIVLHDINFASVYADNILALKGNHLHINASKNQVINGRILEEVFEMPFNIQEINGQKISVYY
jgi:iron complex transport system ATP-binding protein